MKIMPRVPHVPWSDADIRSIGDPEIIEAKDVLGGVESVKEANVYKHAVYYNRTMTSDAMASNSANSTFRNRSAFSYFMSYNHGYGKKVAAPWSNASFDAQAFWDALLKVLQDRYASTTVLCVHRGCDNIKATKSGNKSLCDEHFTETQVPYLFRAIDAVTTPSQQIRAGMLAYDLARNPERLMAYIEMAFVVGSLMGDLRDGASQASNAAGWMRNKLR